MGLRRVTVNENGRAGTVPSGSAIRYGDPVSGRGSDTHQEKAVGARCACHWRGLTKMLFSEEVSCGPSIES